MRRYDEFNDVHIKNDSLGTEFGKTQGQEFTHFGGNPESGRSSANEVEIINDDREKNGQIGASKTKYEEKKEEQKQQETVKQATNVATSSGVGAVGATAGAVAGASVVAVATVGATLGAAIASTTTAKFEYIEASSHAVYYSLNLEEPNDFSFLLHFENAELGYHESNSLVEGFNKGEFNGLTPETEYYVYVQSTDISQTKILETYVTTEPEYSEPEPEPEPISLAEFKEFYFSKTANFRTNSFDLSFTYEDPKDEMSDFTFKLVSTYGTRVYNLEKTQETQTLRGASPAPNENIPDLDFTDGTEYSYEFSYAIGDERKVVEEGTVVFTDNSNAKQEFRGVELSREADFLQNVVYVTLDFDNDLNHLSNFVFTLKSADGTNYIFNLQTTTDKQALNLRNGIQGAEGGDTNGLVLEDTAFTYTLSYLDKGESKTVESEEEIIFEDISGAVQEFRSLTIHENANFIDKYFYVTLDFDNDYLHFDNFELMLYSERQSALTFALQTTKEKQKVYLKDATIEGRPIDQDMVAELSLDYEFYYAYNYTDRGDLVADEGQNPVTFYDESGAQSEFRGIIIDSEANFLTKDISVTLDMDNDYGYFRSFALRLQSQGKVTLIYSLEATSEKQTLSISDAEVESVSGQSVNDFNLHGTFYYELTYYNEHTEEELETTGSLTFTDNSGCLSEFRDISFESQADFDQGIIYFTLDMDNELSEYDQFYLTISWDNYSLWFSVDATNQRQSINLYEGNGNKPTYIDLSGEFDYELTYRYLKNQNFSINSDEPITFTDLYNRVSEVRGITISDYYDMMNGKLEVQLDSVDEYNVLSNFVLFFMRPYVDGGEIQYDTYSFALTETTNTQTLDLNNQECYFDENVEYQWKLTYSDARYGQQELTGTKTIAPKYDFYLGEMNSAVVTSGDNYYAIVNLGFIDNINGISNLTLTLMSQETDNSENPILSEDIALTKTNGYQYVNITSFLNDWHETVDGNTQHESGTASGLPRDLGIAYGIKMDIENEEFVWTSYSTITLDLHDDSRIVGAKALTASMSSNNPVFEIKIYGRDPYYTNYGYTLQFQFGDDPDSVQTFEIPTQESFNAITDIMSVNLANYPNYEPMLNMLRNMPVTVTLSWSSYYTGGAGSITLLENTQISIN